MDILKANTFLNETAAFLTQWCPERPSVAMVLGSGFSAAIADAMTPGSVQSISYAELPHFPRCHNPAHPGRLLVGTLDGHRVAVLSGRVHCYEGYRADEVAYHVRALARWGIQNFILTNAAGSIHPEYRPGDFLAITDHINLLGKNPLTAWPEEPFDRCFVDISKLYDPRLVDAAVQAAAEASVACHTGVYAAMHGPSYESPAEIRMLRVLGADVVGMSTVPEAIALAHARCRVFAMSCISNLAAGLSAGPIEDSEVREVLQMPEVQRGLRAVLRGVMDAFR